MPTVIAIPQQCGECGGKIWDNREGKKNPKAPDFKCRDRSCEWVQWPPKKGEVYADQVGGNIAATVKKAVAPLMPEDFDDPPGPIPSPKPTAKKDGDTAWFDEVLQLYAICSGEADRYSKDPAVRAQVAAFLFEQAWKLRPRSAA